VKFQKMRRPVCCCGFTAADNCGNYNKWLKLTPLIFYIKIVAFTSCSIMRPVLKKGYLKDLLKSKPTINQVKICSTACGCTKCDLCSSKR
jgi:hypothetical protein